MDFPGQQRKYKNSAGRAYKNPEQSWQKPSKWSAYYNVNIFSPFFSFNFKSCKIKIRKCFQEYLFFIRTVAKMTKKLKFFKKIG